MAAILILWLVISCVVAIAANSRGRNAVGWFLISVLLSPILALLLLLVFPNLEVERRFYADDNSLRRNIEGPQYSATVWKVNAIVFAFTVISVAVVVAVTMKIVGIY